MMEWQIIKSSHGGFVAQKGIRIEGGAEVGHKPGCVMPGFLVYESARFDTMAEAKKYIHRRSK